MKLFRLGLSAALLVVLVSACSYLPSLTHRQDIALYSVDQVTLEMAALDWKEPYTPSKSIAAYFDFHGMNPVGVAHYFGYVAINDHRLAVHGFIPENPKGSILFLHGYLDHSGTQKHLIAQSLANGYAILLYDLPGHGLSSGEVADIGAIVENAELLKHMVSIAEDELPAPLHLVSHSTGSSIAFEYLSHVAQTSIEEVVFLAPLVHHKRWGLVKTFHPLVSGLTSRVRRPLKKNYSDPDYRAFLVSDPLQSNIVSMSFLDYLYEWNALVSTYPKMDRRVLILQGEQDTVVDWRYNLDFYKSKIVQPSVKLLPAARHQLLNESEAVRKEVFSQLFAHIQK